MLNSKKEFKEPLIYNSIGQITKLNLVSSQAKGEITSHTISIYFCIGSENQRYRVEFLFWGIQLYNKHYKLKRGLIKHIRYTVTA